MDYLIINLILVLLLALATAFCLFYSWKIISTKNLNSKQLAITLISGFILWFLISILLALTTNFWGEVGIRWFDGNGWYLSLITAMTCTLIHHQLLMFLVKK